MVSIVAWLMVAIRYFNHHKKGFAIDSRSLVNRNSLTRLNGLCIVSVRVQITALDFLIFMGKYLGLVVVAIGGKWKYLFYCSKYCPKSNPLNNPGETAELTHSRAIRERSRVPPLEHFTEEPIQKSPYKVR